MRPLGLFLTIVLSVGIQAAGKDPPAVGVSSRESETANSTSSVARDKFLFGSFSTTRYTQVVASTSTVFFSCLSGTSGGAVCMGRNTKRKKRMLQNDMTIGDSPNVPEVESSQATSPEKTDLAPVESTNNSKLAFTIWTTSRTTTQVTVFFTNTSTTIRLSYYCFAGGIQFPQFNCQLAGK
ncbi:hypothetical protein SK128_016681 [Halocaridina rubra]|uniref:Uncharacterized protein n=1 Tax=Halocaridina rubra TaxID=373956 RepID=A0AAN8X1W4_HALRR